MSDLRYPTWQEPLRRALWEFDPAKKQAASHAAFAAIEARKSELDGDVADFSERDALEDAVKLLNIVRTEG
jgi:hypothetical protein